MPNRVDLGVKIKQPKGVGLPAQPTRLGLSYFFYFLKG